MIYPYISELLSQEYMGCITSGSGKMDCGNKPCPSLIDTRGTDGWKIDSELSRKKA